MDNSQKYITLKGILVELSTFQHQNTTIVMMLNL